jgi:hypothetical protein
MMVMPSKSTPLSASRAPSTVLLAMATLLRRNAAFENGSARKNRVQAGVAHAHVAA